jgi:hypothetical protein
MVLCATHSNKILGPDFFSRLYYIYTYANALESNGAYLHRLPLHSLHHVWAQQDGEL